MINPPTEKQIKYAEAISSSLGVPLPKELTRQSLFLFIKSNKQEFDRMTTISAMHLTTTHLSEMPKYLDDGIDQYDDDCDDMFDILGPDPILGGLL